LLGGGTAAPGSFSRVTPDGTRTAIPSKAVNVRLDRGDRFVMETSGGGGLGDPRTRPVADVRADARAGKVSRAAAAAVYGVVIAPDGLVDEPATAALRRRG
jgi:N-methylhydantoinase B